MSVSEFCSVPSSVEIMALEICSVVASTDSIRIYHGNDLNLVISAKKVTLLILAQEEVYQPFADKRTRSFAWMLPSNYNDQRPQLYFAVWLSNSKSLYFVLADCGSNDLSFQHFLLVLHLFHAL